MFTFFNDIFFMILFRQKVQVPVDRPVPVPQPYPVPVVRNVSFFLLKLFAQQNQRKKCFNVL